MPASKFNLYCSRCPTDKDRSEVQLPASQGLSVQEVMERSQNIIHPSPAPVSTKILLCYTVKLRATLFLTLEVSELKIRSLQIFKFHYCITNPTQPRWKEMHKDTHCRGKGREEQRHLEEILPPNRLCTCKKSVQGRNQVQPVSCAKIGEKGQKFC